MNNNIKVQEYSEEYAEEALKMWRDSKEEAIGQPEEHDFESHLKYLINTLTKNDLVFLAIDSSLDKPVGLLAVNVEEVSLNQLYIHRGYQKQGIGYCLLQKAKQLSPRGLKLYTFEVNKIAQRFYENNGFKIIGRGMAEQEKLPDIEYQWIGEI